MQKKLFPTALSRCILNTVVLAVGFTVLQLLISGKVINRYNSDLMIQICYNIILAVSLNLAAGFLGQLPLGHAGFMGVGAYAAALFSKAVELPELLEFPMAVVLGALVAGVFGVLIGLPALRLKGDYLAIITLGFSEIIRVIIQNLEFTGGAIGLRSIPKYSSFAWCFLWMVLTIFCIHSLIKSRHGRAILSIREDEIAAEASGISTTFYKVAAFAISAAFAGVAGALYAHYMRILDPSTFGFMKSAEILVMVVLGGMGSIIGSVVSASVLTLLPEMLRGFSEYRMIIYSLVLVIVMIFKPSGLFGRYDFSLGRTVDTAFARVRSLIRPKKGGDA